MSYRGYGRDRNVRHYDDEDRYDRESSRRRDYDYDHDRGSYEREDRYGRDRRESRGVLERAGDQVRSWLGDEDAERRTRMERRDRYDREDYGDYGRRSYSELRPRDERRYRQEGSSGYDPNYPTLYGEQESRYREGRLTRGPHRGLGPRGYQRSDQRIWEDINERLTEDDEIDASDVEATVNRGEVTLSGTAWNRWEKRRIEDIVESVSGVKDVINQLRVRRTGESRAQGHRGRRILDVADDIRGKPIIRSNTGEKLGEVSDVIIDPIQGMLLGLLIRDPEDHERALVTRDVIIGNDAVMASESARMDDDAVDGVLSQGVPAASRIVGTNVVTEDGNLIGRVSQVFISMDTHRVFYRISESRLRQLFGGGFYIPGDIVRAYSPDGGRIIVPVDTEDRHAVSSIDEILGRMGLDADRSRDTATEQQPGETQTRSRSTTTRSR